MNKVKGVTASTMGMRHRKKNWWDDDDNTFEDKWMTGPAADNANVPNPTSILNPARADKDVILISQQNRFDGQSIRSMKSNPYMRQNNTTHEADEQYTFAFIAEPKVDAEV